MRLAASRFLAKPRLTLNFIAVLRDVTVITDLVRLQRI
jgi:hypothetical protein